MSIRCGNIAVHGRDREVGPQHHDSVEQVRQCFTTFGGIYSHEEVAKFGMTQEEHEHFLGLDVEPSPEQEEEAQRRQSRYAR